MNWGKCSAPKEERAKSIYWSAEEKEEEAQIGRQAGAVGETGRSTNST